MNAWLLDLLACPRHRTILTLDLDSLSCAAGCRFPVVDGVPVLLLEEADQTMDLVLTSLQQTKIQNTDGGLYVDSLGLSDQEKRGILELSRVDGPAVDPVVSYLVGATNGNAYKDQIGHLADYPIPELRVPASQNQVFLEVGCNWGRWCIAASRSGFRVVGLDPSLGAVMAARRLARQLGTEAAYVVGDARFLPFKTCAIDRAFSYSVLQHLSRENAALSVMEMGRVLKVGGTCHVQMPTKLGLRCLYHQLRRRFREGIGFEVRYWSLPSLQVLFSERIGATTFSVDCFFGIGLQFSDLRFMSPTLKLIVCASEALRLMSRVVTPLIWLADSVYVASVKREVSPQSPTVSNRVDHSDDESHPRS